MTKSGGQFTL